MTIEQIIAELTGLAQEQAGAAHILETTRFEPELQALTPGAIDDARRKAPACGEAIRFLRSGSPPEDPRVTEMRALMTGVA